MRARLIAILVGFALGLGGAGYAAAQGRAEKARPGGSSAEHRSEQGTENANPQHAPDATRGQSRAAERRSDSGAEHERATENARGDEGFFGAVRRFFGWGRSQERMSEQGRAHQQATEQERGPDAKPADED